MRGDPASMALGGQVEPSGTQLREASQQIVLGAQSARAQKPPEASLAVVPSGVVALSRTMAASIAALPSAPMVPPSSVGAIEAPHALAKTAKPKEAPRRERVREKRLFMAATVAQSARRQ